MRFLIYVLLIIIAFQTSCIQQKTLISELDKTAKHFHKAVANVDVSEEIYHRNLFNLIDPKSNVDSLIKDYYEHWQNNKTSTSYPIKVELNKITLVRYNRAKIEMHCYWHDSFFGNYLYITESIWIRKNKLWYRSGFPERNISEYELD
jgi:hypothetical protein